MYNILVDINSFQTETGLDNRTLKELYILFVEEISKYSNELEEKLLASKFDEIEQITHNIKGLASSYRCTHVLDIATIINGKCKNDDFVNINDIIKKLQHHIEEAVVEIQNYFIYEL